MNTLPETTLSKIIRNTQTAKSVTTFENQRQNTGNVLSKSVMFNTSDHPAHLFFKN